MRATARSPRRTPQRNGECRREPSSYLSFSVFGNRFGGAAEEGDEGEEEKGGPAAGRRAPWGREIHLAGR